MQYHTWLRARLITGQDTAAALWLAPEDAAGQNSDWKAHATASRAHSCPFVVQNDPLAKPLHDRSKAGRPELHSFVLLTVAFFA